MEKSKVLLGNTSQLQMRNHSANLEDFQDCYAEFQPWHHQAMDANVKTVNLGILEEVKSFAKGDPTKLTSPRGKNILSHITSKVLDNYLDPVTNPGELVKRLYIPAAVSIILTEAF